MNIDDVRKQLQAAIGEENVLFSEMDLMLYEYDAFLERSRPDVVVLPGSTEEVSQVVLIANAAGLPVTARGSATSLSGGPVPLKGGVVIHLSRMNVIEEIDVVNRTATVQPGVITLDLQNAAAKQGLQYAPDPASQKTSTLGGNIGENSGGPHCLKYGVTTNHILGLEVVLPDGSVVTTGGPARDYPGLDLTGLLVGSEGVLAIATKIILRLIAQPESVETMLVLYDSIEDASNTVSAIIADGIVPATLEMMDNPVIQAVEDSVAAGYPRDAAAVLIVEVDGLADGLKRQVDRIIEICKENKAREVRTAKDDAERAKLWAGRKGAFGAVSRLRPSYMVCDGTVPRTKLPATLKQVMAIGKKYDLQIGNVFHAGDGNLHPLIMFDARDRDETERVMTAASEILQCCVDMGGTISGEHGIGMEKLKEMNMIFSETDFDYMRRIKKSFDPTGLFNPGKVIPPAPEEAGV